MRIAFDVVEQEDRARAGRELRSGLLDRGGEQPAFRVRLDRCRIVLHVHLHRRRALRTPERIQRAIHCDAVRPRPELRVAAKARQRPEDLDPDFLRDVRRQIGVVTDQPPDDDVDVRRMPGPQGPHRRLVAREGSLYGELFSLHDVQRIGHGGDMNGCRGDRACARGSFGGVARARHTPWRPRPTADRPNRLQMAPALVPSEVQAPKKSPVTRSSKVAQMPFGGGIQRSGRYQAGTAYPVT